MPGEKPSVGGGKAFASMKGEMKHCRDFLLKCKKSFACLLYVFKRQSSAEGDCSFDARDRSCLGWQAFEGLPRLSLVSRSPSTPSP